MIRVYHATGDMFRETLDYGKVGVTQARIKQIWEQGGYILVAEANTDNLDVAYKLTNTIDRCWWKNEKVKPLFAGEACRSTSVGDIMRHEESEIDYIVTRVGFQEIRL